MIKLITHTDLDGVGCAILATIVFKNNIDITYCHVPDEVNEYLNKNLNELNTYEKVYITDCSCDEQYFKLIPHIRLFDHHITAESLNKFSNATVKVELNNRKTCGTELFYNYLIQHGKINNRSFFVELVRSFDTWDWKNEKYQLPYYLNNLLYIDGITNFVDNYAKRMEKYDLNELTLFSERERILLNHEVNQINKYIDKKKQYVRIVNTDKYKIGFSFVDRNQSIFGNEMCQQLGCDIAIILGLDVGVIQFRTANENIDVSTLAKVFNGGGHKTASGGKFEPEEINKLIDYVVVKLGDYIGKRIN